MDLVKIPFTLRLRVPFRGLNVRSGLLLNAGDRWAEFSPFPDYDTPAAARWLRAAIEALNEDAPAPRRRRIPVNVTVPAVDPSTARSLVEESGCSTAKVKVGDPQGEERVAAVRDALGPSGRIRVDVNGAWSVEEAATRIATLARYDLEYVEQPVATVSEMAALRRRVDVPLAADESIRRGDPFDVVRREAADLIVLKAHPLGGVRRALSLYDALELPAVVSSALETSVGMSVNVALAAVLPDLPYACGLGTIPLFERDIAREPLVPVAGHIEVRHVEVDRAALDAVVPDCATADELNARFEQAARAAA